MHCYLKGILFHRFIVLELEQPGKSNVWLRLDRRTTGMKTLFKGFGKTPANDTVCLSITPSKLSSLSFHVYASY